LRWFKSMYTLQGKTRPTCHVRFPHQSMYAWRTLPAGGPRTGQPFMSHRQSWAGPLLPRKRAPNIIHSAPTDQSVGPYPASLSSQPMKQWRQSQASINDRLLGLVGPYHHHATGTFNTCSWGSTHRSLTDTGGGYNLRGAGLPHTHSPTFPTSHLHFSLVAPTSLHFN
jgi:hypothetical protein